MAISFYQDIYPMLSKKYPNRKIYVIGDHHFDHNNIINYTRGNFLNVDTMNTYIINCHNKVITENDIVIFLGDLGFQKRFLEIHLSKMNGHKYLILGNHDNEKIIKSYHSLGLEGVFMMPIKVQNNYLSHEPLYNGERNDLHFKLLVDEFAKQKNGINYHGHIHTKKENILPYYNATCEALEYNPLFIGYTGNYCLDNDKELLINSKYFDRILEDLQRKHNLNPKLIIADYIYSTMLEANQAYYQSCFVNGSFALYKKYDFISNFSDLDIGFIHCSTYAKSKSYTKLKNMTDSVYEQLKKINGINLKFYKRYNDMRIFESYFTSNNGYYTNCIFDANVIPYDFYRDTDFLVQENKTTIERYLRIPFLSLPSEYHFPNYTTQFLTPNGDIATLLLQILFQKGNNAKKELAIKKINYVYNKVKNHRDFQEFEDIFTRFLLRNISFLYMLNRFSEIEYIQNMSIDTSNLLPMLPTELASQLFDAIENPNSIFSEIYYEICNTPLENTFKKSTELVDKIKIKK